MLHIHSSVLYFLSLVHCSAVGAVEAFAALRRLAQTSLVTFNNDICTACQKVRVVILMQSICNVHTCTCMYNVRMYM